MGCFGVLSTVLLPSASVFGLSLLGLRSDEVSTHVLSPPDEVRGQLPPPFYVNAHWLQVSFADVPEAKMPASLGSLSRDQFTVEQVFWDPFVRYTNDLPKPGQPALLKKDGYGLNLGLVKDQEVGYAVRPLDAQDVL